MIMVNDITNITNWSSTESNVLVIKFRLWVAALQIIFCFGKRLIIRIESRWFWFCTFICFSNHCLCYSSVFIFSDSFFELNKPPNILFIFDWSEFWTSNFVFFIELILQIETSSFNSSIFFSCWEISCLVHIIGTL